MAGLHVNILSAIVVCRQACLVGSRRAMIRLNSWNLVKFFRSKAVIVQMKRNMADVSGMRADYHSKDGIFDIRHLKCQEPIGQFGAWLEEACKVPTIQEPNAMALATATKSGVPSVRMVLLKGYDEIGFKFYTNYESRKAQELEENPKCSLMFYWEPLKRSVRIEGSVEKLTAAESEKYFHSRPQCSQLGAMVSRQSTIVANREYLDEKLGKLEKEYADTNKPVPKPNYWGGYLVRPEVVEFWQGQTNRLHDRIVFCRQAPEKSEDSEMYHSGTNGWVFCRLSP